DVGSDTGKPGQRAARRRFQLSITDKSRSVNQRESRKLDAGFQAQAARIANRREGKSLSLGRCSHNKRGERREMLPPIDVGCLERAVQHIFETSSEKNGVAGV